MVSSGMCAKSAAAQAFASTVPGAAIAKSARCSGSRRRDCSAPQGPPAPGPGPICIQAHVHAHAACTCTCACTTGTTHMAHAL
eukprot:3517842-Prymnesium_polylepis.1